MVSDNPDLIRKLKNDRKRLELILKGSNTGTWEWNMKTGKLVVNGKWSELLGYESGDFRPATINEWRSCIHPEDQKKSTQALENYLAGKMDFYECEVRMKHKDGHWVWLLNRGSVFKRTGDGDPLLMSGTHIEISRLKECLVRRELEEKRLLLALRVTKASVFEHDFSDDSIFTTPELFRDIGYMAEECPGSLEDFADLIHPEEIESARAVLADYLSGGADHYYCSFRLRTKENNWIWCDAVGEIILWDDQGKPAKLLGIIKNINDNQPAYIQQEENEAV